MNGQPREDDKANIDGHKQCYLEVEEAVLAQPAFLQTQGPKGQMTNDFCPPRKYLCLLTMLAIRVTLGSSTRGLCGCLDSVVCLLAGPAGSQLLWCHSIGI
jgi:hypothetical protein